MNFNLTRVFTSLLQTGEQRTKSGVDSRATILVVGRQPPIEAGRLSRSDRLCLCHQER